MELWVLFVKTAQHWPFASDFAYSNLSRFGRSQVDCANFSFHFTIVGCLKAPKLDLSHFDEFSRFPNSLQSRIFFHECSFGKPPSLHSRHVQLIVDFEARLALCQYPPNLLHLFHWSWLCAFCAQILFLVPRANQTQSIWVGVSFAHFFNLAQ